MPKAVYSEIINTHFKMMKMDFNEYMSYCSANYQRMHNILSQAEYPLGALQSYQVDDISLLQFNVKERKTFTDTIEIYFKNQTIAKWIGNLYFEVKMYHDAQLVEVSGYHHPEKKLHTTSCMPPLFPYWEKWQTNKLLSEILSYYLLHTKSK